MSAQESILIPNCRCGRRMMVTGKPDVFVCMNCDGVQKQEVGLQPRPRIITPQDRAYDAQIELEAIGWYPKKKKDGGRA